LPKLKSLKFLWRPKSFRFNQTERFRRPAEALTPLMKDHQHDVSFLIKLAAFQASGGAEH
jgi:hypothetical protein